MLEDHFTKPLQGQAFRNFRSLIMNVDPSIPDCDMAWDRDPSVVHPASPRPQECVGSNSAKAKGDVSRRVAQGARMARREKRDDVV